MLQVVREAEHVKVLESGRVLVDGLRGAGDHHVEWDGTDAGGRRVGSGVYLYRLVTATQTEHRKMTLVQ